MTSSVFRGPCLMVFCAALTCNLAPAALGEQPKDKIPGARWEFTLETKNGKEVGQGKFRAENFKVFQAARQVGTYSESGTQVTVTFTMGKLKGVASLVKTSNELPGGREGSNERMGPWRK